MCDREKLVPGSARWCECCGLNCFNFCASCLQQKYCTPPFNICVNDTAYPCGSIALTCTTKFLSAGNTPSPRPLPTTAVDPISSLLQSFCRSCDKVFDVVGSNKWCSCCSSNCYGNCTMCINSGFCDAKSKTNCLASPDFPCSSATNQCKKSTPSPTPFHYTTKPPSSVTSGLDLFFTILQFVGELFVPIVWFCACLYIGCRAVFCPRDARSSNASGVAALEASAAASNNRLTLAPTTRSNAVPDGWFPVISAEVAPTPPEICAICLGHIRHPTMTPCQLYVEDR